MKKINTIIVLLILGLYFAAADHSEKKCEKSEDCKGQFEYCNKEKLCSKLGFGHIGHYV